MWLDVWRHVLGEKPKPQPSPHRAHHVPHLDAKHWRLVTCGQACHRDPALGRRVVRAAQSSVDAVVHVQTATVVPTQSNPWLSMLGMDPGRVAQGSGSGVILDRQGWIVTNHHVIDGAQRIQVALSDGSTMEAELIGSDPSTDLALLKTTPAKNLPTLSFGNSDEVNVGEWVLAVGNPLNLTSTVTAGIVSAKGRNLRLLEPDARRDIYPVESFLQTDAAVNPGNSGGALVNLDGELIGINTAIASQTGSYAGYSFAIPSSIVRKVVDDLREYGRVQRAYLGIQVDQRDPGVRVAGVFRERGQCSWAATWRPHRSHRRHLGVHLPCLARAVVQTPSRRAHCRATPPRRTATPERSGTPRAKRSDVHDRRSPSHPHL